jgi:hypothetical protein
MLPFPAELALRGFVVQTNAAFAASSCPCRLLLHVLLLHVTLPRNAMAWPQ